MAQKKKFTPEQELKHYNVRKLFLYIRYLVPDDKVYKQFLEMRLEKIFPEEGYVKMASHIKYIDTQILPGRKAIGPEWQARLEQMFSLPTGALDFPPL